MKDTRTRYLPGRFFLIAFIVAWFFWFADAYFSWNGGSQVLQGLLIFLGICGPVAASLIMFRQARSPELWSDYLYRLISLRRINLRTLPFIVFLFPAMICIAIAISLLFGKSPDQFAILFSPAIMTIPALTGIFLAPALEEAGWRGYGVDSLRSRFSLFFTSVSFGLLWAFWHAPLFLINGFYQNSLLSSWLFTTNFFASTVVMAFLVNWVFYRNNRSIIACILFHLSADVSMSFIPAEQFTKCIVTVLMVLVAVVIVIGDYDLFFEKRLR
ncbi:MULTISPECIES: CPBP family intramembrane glutamic endopeptidase [unclassified Methanoregula]|uniref:CPBP family intramembrane glutamic endopeptidase n=1 Tax=unclassified Methanoregula TaxID=2649730 RepID=UPI0025E7421C|nr:MULTISPECIES: CPBP family intramembrane glutamic endopeptidase [unclassified Methanoregula]